MTKNLVQPDDYKQAKNNVKKEGDGDRMTGVSNHFHLDHPVAVNRDQNRSDEQRLQCNPLCSLGEAFHRHRVYHYPSPSSMDRLVNSTRGFAIFLLASLVIQSLCSSKMRDPTILDPRQLPIRQSRTRLSRRLATSAKRLSFAYQSLFCAVTRISALHFRLLGVAYP